MEITQHARYTCTFCGKVRPYRLYQASMSPSLICLPFWIGLRKTPGRRYLEMQLVQEVHRRWCVDPLDNGGCDRPQVCLSDCVIPAFPLTTVCSTVRRLRDLTEA